MTGPAVVELDIEVRYAETDQMGLVHHANYLIWFELARTSLCKKSGYHYSEIEDLGYLMIVTDAAVNYRRGIHYGDNVAVSCWIESLKSRTVQFGYTVRRSAQVAATGMTRHLWIQEASRKPCRIPPVIQETFTQLAGGSN